MTEFEKALLKELKKLRKSLDDVAVILNEIAQDIHEGVDVAKKVTL